jgi:hypothetical protein
MLGLDATEDYEDYEEIEVGGSERRYGGEGKEFNFGFEGSQVLPVCTSDKCKHLTGTIEV